MSVFDFSGKGILSGILHSISRERKLGELGVTIDELCVLKFMIIQCFDFFFKKNVLFLFLLLFSSSC